MSQNKPLASGQSKLLQCQKERHRDILATIISRSTLQKIDTSDSTTEASWVFLGDTYVSRLNSQSCFEDKLNESRTM